MITLDFLLNDMVVRRPMSPPHKHMLYAENPSPLIIIQVGCCDSASIGCCTTQSGILS